eukprot:TRINITY_DN2497_c4_g2_i1.p1 TRINITY_DN2497_c4_g2~~TRINITY_DN2497_c4_g2_i1.p1  ORF type:complete len:588 (+),score=162.54 TRINITY_DN2497_c4_g2_i1:24-1766(+)
MVATYSFRHNPENDPYALPVPVPAAVTAEMESRLPGSPPPMPLQEGDEKADPAPDDILPFDREVGRLRTPSAGSAKRDSMVNAASHATEGGTWATAVASSGSPRRSASPTSGEIPATSDPENTPAPAPPPSNPRELVHRLVLICDQASLESSPRVDSEIEWALSQVSTDDQWEALKSEYALVKDSEGPANLALLLHEGMSKHSYRHLRAAIEKRGISEFYPADHSEPLLPYEKRNILIGYLIGVLSVVLAILLDVTGVAEDFSDLAQKADCEDCVRYCDLANEAPLKIDVDENDGQDDFHVRTHRRTIACAIRVFHVQEFGPFEVPGIWMGAIGAVVFMCLLTYFSGWLHLQRGWRVNYTRKITHCTGYIANVVVRFVIGSGEEIETIASLILTSALILMMFHVFLLKPMRKRFNFCRVMFSGIDRPEDRPYTLRWNASQNCAYFFVFIPVTYALIARGMYQLMLIPVLVIGFGDGLAEPVGIRWGRHKYTSRAIWYHGKCCAGRFTRSLEGSSVVFAATVVAVAVCYPWFESANQFAAAIATLPPVLTLAEAVGPHTWDNPFLLGIGGGLLVLIVETIH